MLNCLIAFTVILMFAYFLYAEFNLNTNLTPLVSIAVLVDIAIAFALANRLKTGVIISYIVGVSCFLYSAIRGNFNKKSKDFFTAGTVMFTVFSLAMLMFLFMRKPLMFSWDEFSFWGISQKLVKSHDALYTYYKSSMIGNSTPPALAVLTYYFQAFNRQFIEQVCFFAYDVMFFACCCAMCAGVKKQEWDSQIGLFLLGYLLPFIFSVYTRLVYMNNCYITAYADYPLGFLFIGGFCVYFFSGYKNEKNTLPLLPVLMLLTLTKDMGLALGCIIAFMAFFDMLVSGSEYRFIAVKGLVAKIISRATMVFTVGASYFAWSFHMARVMMRDQFNLGGETSMSMGGMLVRGVKQLLRIGQPYEKYVIIEKSMLQAFFNNTVFMFGSGFRLFCIISILFVIAFVLCDKQGKWRTLAMYLTSLTGFVGYYVFHLFLYVYIFKDNGYGLTSYSRYMSSYYMGWLAFAFIALSLGLAGWRKYAKLAILCLTVGVFARLSYLRSPDTIFISDSNLSYDTRLAVQGGAKAVSSAIGEDDVIFVLCGDDNSEKWFMYTYELADNLVIEDISGSLIAPEKIDVPEEWQKLMYQRFVDCGVTHLLIDYADAPMCEKYSSLFADSLETIGKGHVAYYKVNYQNDWFSFDLVKEGVV